MVKTFVILSSIFSFSNASLRFLDNQCQAQETKIDCGFTGVDQSQCESKGCCWSPIDPNPGNLPWCFFNKIDPWVPPQDGKPFNDAEMAKLNEYFTRNIDVGGMVSSPCKVEFGIEGQGGVVAAPDCDTGAGGSYVYAWMRDSALTMRTLWNTNNDRAFTVAKMKKYVNWVIKEHQSTTTTGIDVRTEPKMMLPNPGVVFTSPWCRPQNDGPGLQATSLILLGNYLLDNGETDFVKQYLWTGSSAYNGGAIKFDLEYVANNFRSDSCDLWEEIHSSDLFWNRYTMRFALIRGTEFANRMGDTGAADWYKKKALELTGELMKHWDGKIVFEDANRKLDTAVFIALNEGYNNDDLLTPSSKYVASSIIEFNNYFQNAYVINQYDSARGIPGILYGRYQGDVYHNGGAWVLNTAALAQSYYNSGIDVFERLKALPDNEAMDFWSKLIGTKPGNISEFGKAMLTLGDGVLFRIRAHVEGGDFHLPEQLDRNTGSYLSAKDLTWSYAEVLKAMNKRQKLINLIPTPSKEMSE